MARELRRRSYQMRRALTGLTLASTAALFGCRSDAGSAKPTRCVHERESSAGRGGESGDTNPLEEPDWVIAGVAIVAQVTALSDVVAPSQDWCENHTWPSHTVRVRIDEVMYAGPFAPSVPSVGDEIEVMAVNTLFAISADPTADAASDYTFQEAIVGLDENAMNPLDPSETVPWLAYGTGHIASIDELDRWQSAIDEQTALDEQFGSVGE